MEIFDIYDEPSTINFDGTATILFYNDNFSITNAVQENAFPSTILFCNQFLVFMVCVLNVHLMESNAEYVISFGARFCPVDWKRLKGFLFCAHAWQKRHVRVCMFLS